MNQLDRLWKHFDAGGSLTPGEALQHLGIYALSQRCGELRRLGYPIGWKWERQPSGAQCKRYYSQRRSACTV